MRAGKWVVVCAVTAALAACGGGGGGGGGGAGVDSPSPVPVRLRGVAATGAAVAAAAVEARCARGDGAALTSADGSFTLEIADGRQPCILRVTDPVSAISMYSVAEAEAAVANITPLTTLVTANILGVAPADGFANFDAAAQSRVTVDGIGAATSRVKAAVATLGPGADLGNVDIMKGALVAAHGDTAGDAHDRKIDALMATLAAADKQLPDLEAKLQRAATDAEASAGLSAVVGDAQYALPGCPSARSGDVWVMDFIGTQPRLVNLNYSTMRHTNKSDGASSPIEVLRDAGGQAIPCAFSVAAPLGSIEFHISPSGIGFWRDGSDFGLGVPAQSRWSLSDPAFRGSFNSLMFVREKTSGVRHAAPAWVEVGADGQLQNSICELPADITQARPACSKAVEAGDGQDIRCTPMAGGGLSCTAPDGTTAVGIPHMSGGQVSLFMAITSMTLDKMRVGGLMVMTRAHARTLPTLGVRVPADLGWQAGVMPNGGAVFSGGSVEYWVESVDVAGSSYITSTTDADGDTRLATRYANSPAAGFLLSRTDTTLAVTLSSTAGWSVTATRDDGSPTVDGWMVSVRVPR